MKANKYNPYIQYQHTNRSFQDKSTHPQYTSNIHVCSLQNNIHVSKVHCGSAVRFGQALPAYLITAHHLYASLR